MFVDHLYDKVLMAPLKAKETPSDELFIVSGYASATFVLRHLSEAKVANPNMKLHLIIGMEFQRHEHPAYLRLLSKFQNSFFGYYYDGAPSVHAKAYCWYRNGEPSLGFAGSANYSQNGFLPNKQRNQMAEDSPSDIKNFFDSLLPDSTPIDEYEPPQINVKLRDYGEDVEPGKIKWIKEGVSVRISLLKRDGDLSLAGSGLNWGHRKNKLKRETNQAYLRIPKATHKVKGFLPPRAYSFTVLTDDNESFDCTIQQQGDKGLSTTNNNSDLGRYFRRRLGVKDGAVVYKQDLLDYGRTDYLLTKLNDEAFYLDFSAPEVELQ